MKCKYCGKSAGFLRFAHKECKELHNSSTQKLKMSMHDFFKSNTCYADICDQTTDLVNLGHIKQDEFNSILCAEIWEQIKSNPQPYSLLTFISELPSSLLGRFKNAAGYISFRDRTIASIVNEIFKTEKIEKSEFDRVAKVSSNSGHTGLNDLIVKELEKRVNSYLEDGLIETEEEEALGNFIEDTGISVSEISKSQAYAHFIQSLVLRDLQEGKTPSRINFGSLPILMTKKEYPIWAYNSVKGYEEKTGKKYVGGSRGTSVRICKGVYYRVGASKGYSVDYQYSQPLGVGSLIVTNRALYYVSPSKTIKILIPKIVSVEPYSDGIAIVKDGVRAHPLYFVGFDSWFLMNLFPLIND